MRTLAASHTLTADRLRPTFLVLRTNTRFWARSPMPAAGWRTSPDSDPAVFQYYPGHGLQLQPLASWGRANAVAGACLAALRSRTTKDRCRSAQLARSLDRLTALGARRSGYLAWEYYFAYGSGSPPWVSGMTQATAIQALARGYRALGKTRWRRAALRALGAFEQAPPSGVSVAGAGGRHYVLYSFAPSHRVFNGGLQAVLGLRDAAALLDSRRAERLFERGERAARREIADVDTGAWSLYSERGAEATLNYHTLIARLPQRALRSRPQAHLLRAGKRFARYEREPTRIGITPLRRVRADRTSTVRFDDLEDLDGQGAAVGDARDEPLARPAARPRPPHADLEARPGAGATGCGSRPRARAGRRASRRARSGSRCPSPPRRRRRARSRGIVTAAPPMRLPAASLDSATPIRRGRNVALFGSPNALRVAIWRRRARLPLDGRHRD